MIHECNCECVNREHEEMGIPSSIPMKFSFRLDRVEAWKENEADFPVTVFMMSGESYLIDTPFEKFNETMKNLK